MGEHRALADQPVVVVDVQVALALGEQRLDPFDLRLVLGEVGVHVQAGVFAIELAGQLQLLGGAGGGEARGHCVVQAALAVPALDQCLAVGIAGFGGVGEVVRGVAVHQYLAGDHAQVQCLGGFEEGVHGGGVHGAEHQGGGGAVAQQLAEEQVGHFAGVGRVGEGALGREGVGVQPVQQLLTVGGDHAGLRVVDVGVDETGGDQRVGVFEDLHAVELGQQVAGVADAGDAAILHQQDAVLEVFVGGLDAHFCRVGDAVEEGGAVGNQTGHGSLVGQCGT